VACTLAALAAADRVAVGIVSGRKLADLRARVGLEGIAYAGNHGLEIQGPGFSFREPASASVIDHLCRLVDELGAALAAIPGAWVEHKELSATVHYRQANPQDIPAVFETVQCLAATLVNARQVDLVHGKMVLEIRPRVAWHKGMAVGWLSERMQAAGAETALLYFGDDHTDEDAFAMLPGAITVHVGQNSATAARYSVRDHAEVHRFMNWLLEGVLTRS
jgi:trehalose 6-phosphate phosphatase